MSDEKFALLYCQYLNTGKDADIRHAESYTRLKLEQAINELFELGYIDGPFDEASEIRGPYHLTDAGRKWMLS